MSLVLVALLVAVYGLVEIAFLEEKILLLLQSLRVVMQQKI
jgi:hypothetical protein